MKTVNIETFSCCQDKDELLKFLLVKVAPVMLKVKPGGLVRLTNCAHARALLNYNAFCVHQQEILDTLQLDYKILRNDNKNIHIMFYDRDLLAKCFADTATALFLREFGYKSGSSVEEHLELLVTRFNSRSFPHEIGIFMGYPLKDVRGFHEKRKNSVKVDKAMWKVFGNPRPSVIAMWNYRFAEDIAKLAIKEYSNINVCIEKMKESVQFVPGS